MFVRLLIDVTAGKLSRSGHLWSGGSVSSKSGREIWDLRLVGNKRCRVLFVVVGVAAVAAAGWPSWTCPWRTWMSVGWCPSDRSSSAGRSLVPSSPCLLRARHNISTRWYAKMWGEKDCRAQIISTDAAPQWRNPHQCGLCSRGNKKRNDGHTTQAHQTHR